MQVINGDFANDLIEAVEDLADIQGQHVIDEDYGGHLFKRCL